MGKLINLSDAILAEAKAAIERGEDIDIQEKSKKARERFLNQLREKVSDAQGVLLKRDYHPE